MKRDQFTWYRSYYEALRTLPAKDFQIAVLAICAYALDEEVPGPLWSSKFCFHFDSSHAGQWEEQSRQSVEETENKSGTNR